MADDDLKRLLEAIRQENAAAHLETRQSIRKETAAALDENRRELREENTAHQETRRHFGVLVEGLQTTIGAIAEGVVSANQRIDRLEVTMKEEFAEVRAMIKFSHSDLDRRMRTLEEIVSDLQGRVERLESSSTH